MQIAKRVRKNHLLRLADGRIVRVIKVRDTFGGFAKIPGNPLSPATILRRRIPRSRYLLTYRDTRGRIGSLYLGVREAWKLGTLHSMVLTLSGQAPKKVRR